MQKILVGFDGSVGSENAIHKAITLIDAGGELVIISVVPLPSEKNLMDEKTHEIMKKRAHSLIETVMKDLGLHDFTITGIVEEGDIASVIIDIANSLNCDIIVLGSTGASKLGMYSIGSIANKVVQYAHKPVMIVR
jgi:nucleotide-binding universal stress UspA family protein